MTMTLENHLASGAAAEALRRDVRQGLTADAKSLPPKWFYDEVGSDLFDEITRLDEYYQTRTERSLELMSTTGLGWGRVTNSH